MRVGTALNRLIIGIEKDFIIYFEENPMIRRLDFVYLELEIYFKKI